MLIKEVISELRTISANIPSEANLYSVENKLDILIKLMKEQNEISDRISVLLENIPRESGVSTHKIEDRLEKIWDKLEEVNSNIEDINHALS